MRSRTTSTSSIGLKHALSVVHAAEEDGDASPACHARRMKWPPDSKRRTRAEGGDGAGGPGEISLNEEKMMNIARWGGLLVIVQK